MKVWTSQFDNKFIMYLQKEDGSPIYHCETELPPVDDLKEFWDIVLTTSVVNLLSQAFPDTEKEVLEKLNPLIGY